MMGHEALVFLNDRAFLSSRHDAPPGHASSIERRHAVVERRPRQRRRSHVEPSAANGWMIFAQLDSPAHRHAHIVRGHRSQEAIGLVYNLSSNSRAVTMEIHNLSRGL
jgi:hypothetical protein